MYYADPLYGSFAIDEPVLLALLDADAVQRLRGVLQHGISGLLAITPPLTRFEHSVGVMLLVRMFGGSLAEQIAALLHDVSHTAFSHVIDYVFDNHVEQSFHDEHQARYIAGTGLPALLADFGYDWRVFLDEAVFPRLEQPAPRLCADRLDYFFRDCVGLRLASPADVRAALSHLTVREQRFVADELQAARWLAYTYIAADQASWANFREVGLYEITAQALRRGLALGAIDQADFWNVDAALWEKLITTDDVELEGYIDLLTPATRFIWDERDPSFIVRTKLRTIDPDVLLASDELVPLSALDPTFDRYRRGYLERHGGAWPMRVVPPARGR
jgi:HD superfamily phosphohydrolase